MQRCEEAPTNGSISTQFLWWRENTMEVGVSEIQRNNHGERASVVTIRLIIRGALGTACEPPAVTTTCASGGVARENSCHFCPQEARCSLRRQLTEPAEPDRRLT